MGGLPYARYYYCYIQSRVYGVELEASQVTGTSGMNIVGTANEFQIFIFEFCIHYNGSYRKETETQNREIILFSSQIIPRDRLVADAP